MPGEVLPESTVTYTVREMLDEQTALLRGIDRRLDAKADKQDLLPIITDLKDHGSRIQNLEDERVADKTVAAVKSKFWHRLWLGVAAVGVPSITTLLIVFVH